MSTPSVSFSPLEERLAGAEHREALSDCQQMLNNASGRLGSEASRHQPVSRFKRFEAARLAIAAASEVVSAVRSPGGRPGTDPRFRNTEAITMNVLPGNGLSLDYVSQTMLTAVSNAEQTLRTTIQTQAASQTQTPSDLLVLQKQIQECLIK